MQVKSYIIQGIISIPILMSISTRTHIKVQQADIIENYFFLLKTAMHLINFIKRGPLFGRWLRMRMVIFTFKLVCLFGEG